MSKIPLLYSTGVCWLSDDGTVEFQGGDVLDAIVIALSKECRFGGHTRGHYSVAEHAVHVAERVYRDTKDPTTAFQALWHEADEGLGVRDINSLLKDRWGKRIIKAAEYLRAAVFAKLGLPAEMPAVIHDVDKEFAVAEAHALLDSAHLVEWPFPPTFRGNFPCWAPARAADEFRAVHRLYAKLREDAK
jgi:uncharacterized protein